MGIEGLNGRWTLTRGDLPIGYEPDRPVDLTPQASQASPRGLGEPGDFFVEKITNRLRELLAQASRGELTLEEPLIVQEARVFGPDFMDWLLRNDLDKKMASSAGIDELWRVYRTYQWFHKQSPADFGVIDWDKLTVDDSVNLGTGKGFRNLGYGSHNRGVYRVRFPDIQTPLVVKLIPIDDPDYVFAEVRNYQIISEWDLGPAFYGITIHPDGETIGIVMDEIPEGINTKNLYFFNRWRERAVTRFNAATVRDIRRIRYFFNLFSVHAADLDLLVAPDGRLRLIDPADFTFFNTNWILPPDPKRFDFNNPESLFIQWILEGMIDPGTLPRLEQGRIFEYVLARYGPDGATERIEALRQKGFVLERTAGQKAPIPADVAVSDVDAMPEHEKMALGGGGGGGSVCEVVDEGPDKGLSYLTGGAASYLGMPAFGLPLAARSAVPLYMRYARVL